MNDKEALVEVHAWMGVSSHLRTRHAIEYIEERLERCAELEEYINAEIRVMIPETHTGPMRRHYCQGRLDVATVVRRILDGTTAPEEA